MDGRINNRSCVLLIFDPSSIEFLIKTLIDPKLLNGNQLLPLSRQRLTVSYFFFFVL